MCAYRWCHEWSFYAVSSESYALHGTTERFQAYDTAPPREPTEGRLLWRDSDAPTTVRVAGTLVSFGSQAHTRATVSVVTRPYPASPVLIHRARGTRTVCERIRSYAEFGTLRFMFTHSERDTHLAMLVGDRDAAELVYDPLVVSILTQSGFPPQGADAVLTSEGGVTSCEPTAARHEPNNNGDEDEDEDEDDAYDLRILRASSGDGMLSSVSPKRTCVFDFAPRSHVTVSSGAARLCTTKE
jgi:hypothetical protein